MFFSKLELSILGAITSRPFNSQLFKIICLSISLLSYSSAFAYEDDIYENPNCNQEEEAKATDEMYNEVLNNIVEASISELLNDVSSVADILIVGETHTESIAKIALIENLELLVNNNYKVLAIEMLNKSNQKLLNQFCEGKINRDSFQKVWASDWPFKKQTQNYLSLIEKACELGLKVYAVDERNHPDILKQPHESMNLRNVAMATNISQIYKVEPTSKIIFLTGSLHGLVAPLDQVDSYTKNFVGNTSVKLELAKINPKVKSVTVNITNTFPLINIPIFCSYKDRTIKLQRHFPESSFVVFKGTKSILFDYVYLGLNN